VSFFVLCTEIEHRDEVETPNVRTKPFSEELQASNVMVD
jgi:hypothetical protein